MAEEFDSKINNEIMGEETENTENSVSDEVIAISAGIAATEVEGVAGMSSGIAGGIVEALGQVNLAKGVRVTTNDNKRDVDLYVILRYGYRVPDVAWNIQEKVKDSIESLTGITVSSVNIHVQGIEFTDSVKDSEEEQ